MSSRDNTYGRHPSFREDLDDFLAGCEDPNCPVHTHTPGHPTYVVPLCHPKGRLAVWYDKENGALCIECGECHAPIGAAAIAPRPMM